MQVNSIQSNQSFGALTIKPEAMKVLKQRVTKEAEIKELRELIKAQEGNIFNAIVEKQVYNGGLSGYVSDGSTYCNNFKEGFFEQLFSSPVKFVKKLCKDADKQMERYNLTSKLDNLA